MRFSFLWAAAVLLAVVTAKIRAAEPADQAPTARELWIRDVTVVSPERSASLQHATVIVRDGKIASITPSGSTKKPDGNAEIIAGQGLFLSPGLIDSHVHTNRALITAAHEVHMPVLIHANSTDGQEFALDSGADIIAHGLWHWNGEPDATELTPRVKGVLDRALKANVGWQPTMRVLGGDRDMFNPELLSDPHFAAVVPPVALAWYRSEDGQWYRNANAPAYLSKELLYSDDREKQWDAIRSPKAHLLGPAIERGNASVRYMAAHHAHFLFGSDTPGSPTYANQPGLNGWLEMHLLQENGLTPAQIVRAATLSNAAALGLASELGTVQPGKRANLLLTRQDPTQSIEAYDGIVKIILGGRVLDRDPLAAH